MTTPIDTATREEVAGLLKIAAALRAPSFRQDSAWHGPKVNYATKPAPLLSDAADAIDDLRARNTELEARVEVLEAENAVLRGRGGPARACTHSICPLGWGRCADAWGRTEMFEDCPALLESLTQHPTRSEGSSSETRPQAAAPPELQASSPDGKEV